MVSGRLVKLKRLELQYSPYIYKWRNDLELMLHYGLFPCFSMTKIEKEIKRNLVSRNRIDFIVVTQKEEVIGTSWLRRIDWRNRTAELNNMIGERGFKSRAYGAEAEFLLLIYAMKDLNMHKVYAKIIEFGSESERIVLDVGFKREAILRKAFYQKGRYWDVYVYGLLQSEFEDFLASSRGLRYLRASRLYKDENEGRWFVKDRHVIVP